MDKIEEVLTRRLCEKNGWEYGSEDYDIAVTEIKWFMSQPEICQLFEPKVIHGLQILKKEEEIK